MNPVERELLRQSLVAALTEYVEPLFKDDMVLTLVARHSTKADRYLILSDDNLAAVAKLLAKEEKRHA